MKTFYKILIAAIAAALCVPAFAGLSPKYPCSDGMVLQQNTKALIWGHGDAGKTVKVTTSWDKASYSATVAEDGVWRIYAATPSASYNHYDIQVKCGSEKYTINDVLIGEVWVASGQSNMEMPLRGFYNCPVENSNYVIANPAGADNVRMFTVGIDPQYEPVSDVAITRGWEKAAPGAVAEMSATAYFFAEQLNRSLDVPVGILALPRGGARVESWLPRATVEGYGTEDCSPEGQEKLLDYTRAYVMYNGMEQPVKGYTARGFIWYQGCSNIRHANEYPERLKNMVDLWRKDIGLGDIPFYQVQIAPYIFDKTENDTVGARLREAQDKACGIISNCDIVCTNDLVLPIERYNIHPSQKRTVGVRLALMALNKTYGMKEIAYCGPRFDRKKFHVDGTTAIVGFTTNEFGICRNWGLEGFEIAGEDRVFHAATAEFHWQTNEVFLTSPNVPKPVAVRYCFKDFQIGNLIGGNELPCFPFRTDEW